MAKILRTRKRTRRKNPEVHVKGHTRKIKKQTVQVVPYIRNVKGKKRSKKRSKK